jgi:tetratricopeptide (TPR) repeat protein
MLGNYQKTIEYGEKVLERNPRDLLARILLADALVEGTVPSAADSAERYKRAEEFARQVLEQLPLAYADDRRPPSIALDVFDSQRRFIESQPRATLGYIHLIKGDNQEAEEELTRAVELNQVSPNGTDYLRLAVAHIRQEEWAEAKTVLERTAQLGGQAAVLAQEYMAVVEKKLNGNPVAEKEQPQE